MFNKKAFAGSLILVSLAGGIVAPAVASKFDATTPVVKAEAAEAEADQTILVYVEVYQNEEFLFQGLKPIRVEQGEDLVAVALSRGGGLTEYGIFLREEIEYLNEGAAVVKLYFSTTVTTTTEEPKTTEAATTEVSTTEIPTTEGPTTEAPTIEVPTTEVATTEAPTTEIPTTEVSSTEVPTTEMPTTEVPTTEAPTTEVQTTEVPTTEAPVTESQKATISFDLAGGSLNGQTGTVNLEAEVGQTITLPEAPTREGYRFLHWKGSVYQAGAQYVVTGPKTFTAVWEPVATPTTTTTSASETPKKILPATGEASSLLSLAGLVLAGFAGFLGFKRKQD